MQMNFAEFLTAVRSGSRGAGPINPERHLSVLAIDPGETTGIAHFEGGLLAYQEQFHSNEVHEHILYVDLLLKKIKPQVLVVEDYRVFSWRAKQHTWSDLHTPQVIGGLKFVAVTRNVPLVLQTPQNAKKFCTDDKLKDWDLWIKGQKHARDAIRHATFFLLFDKG